ncbi:MAG: hypothetical protein ABI688_10700 [Bacteroidota bacterium]
MANDQGDIAKRAGQPGLAGAEKLGGQQKKGFKLGLGDNSTTAGQSSAEYEEENPRPQGSNDNNSPTDKKQAKEKPWKNDPKASAKITDDEDVDEHAATGRNKN